ncbi:MAG: hypothetical protein JO072_14570 [Parafilimonas sp.]|nr:hypothetical protein [Parafilimonas sp.]
MKNNFFEIYNESPGKQVFFHEQILNALSIPVIVCDKNDRLVYFNKKFNDLAQHKISLHSSMKEIINRSDWDNWNENLFKLSNINDNDSCFFNIRFNAVEDEIKYFQLEGKVLQRDELQKPLLYFFTAKDVTKQFTLENKDVLNCGGSAIDWKNFVSKTTSEKKLELAVKDLDRSNKDLEEFAYLASHDLQEPLRKITTFSTRLAYKFEKQLDEEGKVYIDKINAAAGSMKELIDNLLQVSRTVQHVQPFSKTDLNTVLNLVKQNLDLKIEERDVEITQDQLPVIEALPSLMLPLFNNLLSNAIKFSSNDKKPVINITSREISVEDKNNLELPLNRVYYEIKITDNGIGFKQEDAKNIFKIFYRIHSKTDYPGTGIGLAICSKIVAKHNGCIWAESNPGKGSTFFIILPKIQDIKL